MYETMSSHILYMLAQFKKMALHMGPSAGVSGVLGWISLQIKMLNTLGEFTKSALN